MSSRAVLVLVTAWMVLLGALYYAITPLQVVIWPVLGLTGALAIEVGVRRYRPRRPLSWRLLALALVCMVMGDTASMLLNPDMSMTFRVPLIVDLCYLVMFALMAAGLIGLARSGSAARDRAGLLDAVTLIAGVGLVLWVYLIAPRFQTPALPLADQITVVAYPLAYLLLLAAATRLIVTAHWSAPVLLLLTGLVAMFFSDLLYLLGRLNGTWHMGGPAEVGWYLWYLTWGAAALQPSMTRLTEPRSAMPSELSGRRLTVLALSSLIPPVVLLMHAVRGPVHNGVVIALAAAVIFALVLIRLIDAMRTHRRSLSRERQLREAGASLVAATTADEVTQVVRATVARLLTSGHRMILAVGEPDALSADAVLSLGRAQLHYTRELSPQHARDLAGFEVTLSCPLAPANGPTDAHSMGALLVAADEHVLGTMQGALEVLALQAALALSRIKLNDEVNRRDSEAYFRTLVRNTADVILIVGTNGEIRYGSPSASGMFGQDKLAGAKLLDLVLPEQRQRSAGFLDRVRHGASPSESTDWTVLAADGRHLQVEVSCRDLHDDPTVAGLVVTLRDVTQRRLLERELTHRAFHDSLTDLANRALFADRVAQAVQRAQRNGSVTGVLFIDLDDFKDVNDILGHSFGDQLLSVVAERLQGVLRPRDTAARLGGDEFAALIEDTADTSAIEDVAERVVQALSVPVQAGDHLVHTYASVGVATTRHATDGDELLRHADLALYSAKDEGKRQWRHYQPGLHQALVQRLQLRAELDRAVTEKEFSVRYQPVVTLTDGDTVGLEALVRWEHPTRGTLAPAEFIAVAEESGLIVPIGTQVVRQALAAAATWPPRIDGTPYVSINVSARQFRTPGIVDDLLRELDEAGLPAQRLMLEITESLLLREDEHVWTDLAALREASVRIAIDDFGTGYSSLSYLRQVALDVVKIDRSFVGAIASSHQQRALVEGIVRLAHTLDLEVIAEGIETQAERNILMEIGCRYGQGYLFSKPLTADNTMQWLLEDQPAE